MTTRSADGARTLEGRYYTAQEVFDLELERIFSRHWLYAGRGASISEAGKFMLFDQGPESVIMLRDGEDRVQAFHNTCRHRGTRLTTEQEGSFAKSIQCPYHAWTYGLGGELIGAPFMDDVDGFCKDDYPLVSVSLAEWEGGVFLNFDPEAESFESSFAPLIGKFDQWRWGELEIAHRITYEVGANWKLVFQNYSECYHCPNLHPQLNRLTPFRDAWNDIEEGPFLGGPMQMSIEGGSMTMSGQRCAAPLPGVDGEDLNLVHYYTIFPNLLLSLHPDYVLVHRIQPLATDRTRIVCDWLFHPDAMSEPDFDPSDAIEFWNTTNKQDWQVSELSQLGISSKAYRPGPYSELESMIAAWDREYLRVLGEG